MDTVVEPLMQRSIFLFEAENVCEDQGLRGL